MSKLVALGLVLVVALVLVAGCGGNNSQTVFQWVLERVAWNAAGSRLAFTSLGGNGVRYVYSISNTGGNLALLTPSDNDKDLTDEGGKQPAWSPDGADLAIVGRRGGTQALFLIDPAAGAGHRQTRLTNDAVAVAGADAEPSWKPDSTQLVYVSTKNSPSGRWEIHVINRDGSGDTLIARTNDASDAQWPCFNPANTGQIIYQSLVGDTGVDTGLRVLDIATGNTTPIGNTDTNGFRDEGPSVVDTGAGVKVAFASNRNGDFDIWTMNLDGTGAAAITDDTRSDGFPLWTADGARIGFTRDNEAWSVAADGSDEKRLTKRYQSN